MLASIQSNKYCSRTWPIGQQPVKPTSESEACSTLTPEQPVLEGRRGGGLKKTHET